MAEKWNLPVIGPGGELLPFMNHRDREHAAFALYEESGGHERMAAILQSDDEKFFEWGKKLLTERLIKPNTNVNHNHQHSVEGMLSKLDAAEAHGDVLDAEFEEVDPDAAGEK